MQMPFRMPTPKSTVFPYNVSRRFKALTQARYAFSPLSNLNDTNMYVSEILRNWWALALVIIASADDLLTGWLQQDGVFKLSRVTAFSVTQRWVRVDDAQVTQVLQCHQVFGFAQTVEPATAECQCAKVLIDNIQQMLGPWQPVRVKKTGPCWLKMATWTLHDMLHNYGTQMFFFFFLKAHFHPSVLKTVHMNTASVNLSIYIKTQLFWNHSHEHASQ